MISTEKQCWICKRNREELKSVGGYIYTEQISIPKEQHSSELKQHNYTVDWFKVPLCNICEELIIKISGKYEDN